MSGAIFFLQYVDTAICRINKKICDENTKGPLMPVDVQ